MFSQKTLDEGSNWGSIEEWTPEYCKNEYAICPGCDENISKFTEVMQRVGRNIKYDHWFCVSCFKKYVQKASK